MNGPHPFARQMQAVENLVQSLPDWAMLGQPMFSNASADAFDPDREVKKFLAAAFKTAHGRAFLEWVADLTVRAPPGHSGSSFEAAAIAHAKHEARYAVGQAIFLAAKQGEDLLNQRSQPHENTD